MCVTRRIAVMYSMTVREPGIVISVAGSSHPFVGTVGVVMEEQRLVEPDGGSILYRLAPVKTSHLHKKR